MKNYENDGAIQRIKERWPLRVMAQRLGIDLPQRDNQKFRHPFRPDRHPSCTVHGEAIHDWSQGDGRPMDAITLYALARGLENRDAIRELLHEMGEPGRGRPDVTRPPGAPARAAVYKPGLYDGRPSAPTPPPGGSEARTVRTMPPPTRRTETRPQPPPWRKLEIPTLAEVERLIALRSFYRDAVLDAIHSHHVFCAETREGRAWVVTDATGQVSQARRLDGRPWEVIRSKAWTSVREAGLAGWPLGAADIGDRGQVILCEGGPDWIVAHEAQPQFAVCTMLGANQSLHASALKYFAGRQVRILAHGDEAGGKACRRWATQLAEVRARVTAVHLRFGAARDLNDCVKLSHAEYRRHRISTLLT